jgi:diadenosine tetraphosphate (Ap4A) HIT family hydrolase
VVTHRVVATWFDATAAEQVAVMSLVEVVKAQIDRTHRPDGYNVGFNAGVAAGQTIAHLHVHVIPRYLGDLPDPRGGLRWILPARADYWTPR